MMKTFLLTCTLFVASTFHTSAATPGEVLVGSQLPEVTLHNFDGSTVSLSRFRGKPLIINVWASWCGPCRTEMPSLERLANRYNGKQLNVIGISTDDYREKAESLIRQSGISFENYLDRNLMLENMLGANTIPLTILVDANGRILKKVRGTLEWDSPQAIHAINKIFGIKTKAKKVIKTDPMFGLRILSQN